MFHVLAFYVFFKRERGFPLSLIILE